MWSVIGMAGWQYGSFATLLILARLQAINPKLYEAAAVSGAGTLRAFRDVTLPNLRTTLIVIALLRGIWMFNKFDSIWLVTHGGPLEAHRDPAALRLPAGLRGVRLRPGRGGLHRDVRGAAGGRGRLLQAVRPHEGDRGGAVSRLAGATGRSPLLLVVLVLVAFPFYWMLLTSFTPREALFRPPYRLFRLDFSLGNYRELLFATEFARYFVEQPDRGGGRHRAERGRGHPGRLRPHPLRASREEDLRLRHALLLHVPAHADGHPALHPLLRACRCGTPISA